MGLIQWFLSFLPRHGEFIRMGYKGSSTRGEFSLYKKFPAGEVRLYLRPDFQHLALEGACVAVKWTGQSPEPDWTEVGNLFRHWNQSEGVQLFYDDKMELDGPNLGPRLRVIEEKMLLP